jgi:hypothetical protein
VLNVYRSGKVLGAGSPPLGLVAFIQSSDSAALMPLKSLRGAVTVNFPALAPFDASAFIHRYMTSTSAGLCWITAVALLGSTSSIHVAVPLKGASL